MITYFIIKDEVIKVELLDKMAFFEEGENVMVEENGSRQSYKIISISKVLKKIGDKADCIFEIRLM